MQHVVRAFAARKKVIFAVLATGLVLGVGGTMTLASWTDSEWAYGGNGVGGPGIGTSTFVIDQDATNPFAAPGTFSDHPTNALANSLSFGLSALALTPGDTVYAPVAITNSSTSVAGTVVLSPAVAASGVTINDSGNTLRDALHLSIGVMTTAAGSNPANCDAGGFSSFTSLLNDATGLTSTPATTAEALAASGTQVLHYCFKISLPAGASTTLEGHTVAPAWQFTGTSS